MAAMSAAPASTLHSATNDDARDTWDFSSGPNESTETDKPSLWKNDATGRGSNGTTSNPYEYGFEPLPPSRKKISTENLPGSLKGTRSWDRSNRSSDASAKPYLEEGFGSRRTGEKREAPENIVEEWDDERSKWIHRDKLAKIESRELQAAGIVLPRSRATSRHRKGRSLERPNGVKRTTSVTREIPEAVADSSTDAAPSKHGKTPSVAENSLSDQQAPSWDLRLPEEIEAEAEAKGNYWTSTGSTRIPVAKLSPVPISEVYLDRTSPASRRQSDLMGDAETIVYPKTRQRSGSANALLAPGGAGKPGTRSVSDVSPKKNAAPRKSSAPAKSPAGGRPKTRGGPNKDSTSSNGTTRPSTRSGELSPSQKQPEGDPPWMIGSYKPDPRLPPDQQLLPTVARRLQQEKWEKEGKFGTVYDKEFRPLTDDALLSPPEAAGPSAAPKDEEKKGDEWPLKPESKSPTLKQGTYSTIPKISEKPQMSPLPSPRSPNPATTMTTTQPPPAQEPVQRMPEAEDSKKGGCGCCIIM